jgi:hypothetical protein
MLSLRQLLLSVTTMRVIARGGPELKRVRHEGYHLQDYYALSGATRVIVTNSFALLLLS